MMVPTIIPSIIPNRKNAMWDRIAFGLTLAIGIIALISYIENRKTSKMQRELIGLNLREARTRLGIT